MSLIFIVFLSLVSALFYSKLWVYIGNYYYKKTIPTGYGFFIILSFFLAIYYEGENFSIFNSKLFLIGIFLMSIIYWIDDIIGLPALVRFSLQFFLGIYIALYFLTEENVSIFYIMVFTLFTGTCSIFFTNVINFYDGLDLNLSVLMLITLLLAYYVNVDKEIIENIIIYSLGIVIGFSFINVFPKKLYFGDAGCFIFTGILLYIIIGNLFLDNFQVLIIFSALALPALDLIYVNILRLYLNENLFSRNYYYLYQVTYKKFNNYSYLLLQPINLSLILSIAFLIESYGISYFNSLLFSSLFTTLLFYFFCRIFLLK